MTKALLRRMLMFSVLLAVVFLMNPPRAQATESCEECDADRMICVLECQWSSTYELCFFTCGDQYFSCLNNCEVAGDDGGNCGRGRTSCEQGCSTAKSDCVENGGTTCGADYQQCMDQCCL